MRSPFVVAAACLAVACAAPSGSSDEAASSDSNYTAATPDASPGDVPPFTPADAPSAYGARVRVSYAGGAVSESVETASYAALAETNVPWALGIGRSPQGRSVYLRFGALHAKKFDVGTYTCADADALVFEAEWNPDGTAKPPRDAKECSVVIDAIVAGPSAAYARAYGRFAAKAADGGLTTDLNGSFLADFPIGE